MDLTGRISCLRELDLFAGFTGEELTGLAEEVAEIWLPAGAVLFEEGDHGEDMFVLLTGALRICKEKRIIADILPVGYVGEMALIEQQPRSASVRALEESLLLRISASQFDRCLSRQPHALVVLMRSLSSRVRRDTDTLVAEFERANILIHDMRNQMVPFLYLDSLGKESLSDSGRRKLASMAKARDGLARMMEEALSNAKRLKYEPKIESGSLGQLAQEVATVELAAHPDLADKQLKVSVDPRLPNFAFNHLEIRRVFANLLINAGQASQPQGVIEISVRDCGDHACIAVTDQGSGIAEEVRPRIFQPHFTTRPDGHGLGLASFREIVEKRHGGGIAVESVPGVKTVFSFTLPYRERT